MIHRGSSCFATIREAAGGTATVPAKGGDESAWLQSFLDAGELDLDPPLEYVMYGDRYRPAPLCRWW